jgi:hypothetical protein
VCRRQFVSNRRKLVTLGDRVMDSLPKARVMPIKSIGQDRESISSQKHEIGYAGSKLGKNGTAKVLRAKKALGRTTARSKVMARAKAER